MMSVVRCAPALALACVLAACSVRYSPDDFRGHDGGVAGGPDATDPAVLALLAVSPQLAYEGDGWAFIMDDLVGARAIPVVLEGQHMDGATITIDGAGFDNLTIDEATITVTPDGTLAAFPLRIPETPDLAGGDEQAVMVTLTKDDDLGHEVVDNSFLVHGLDAIDLTDGQTFNTGDLPDDLLSRVSHVSITGTVTVTGVKPFRVLATGGISIAGTLHADGGAAPTAGPGGCDGGGSGATALCGDGSGKSAGNLSAGGGGGGFGTGGTAGSGGAGGSEAGDGSLVGLPPLDNPSNRGAGGGGGQPSTLGLGNGNPGGGSGGVVELTTPGALHLADGALITASGGSGGAGGLGGGPGGGGSGGAILIRAGAVADLGTSVALQVRAGAGGNNNAGDGGVGRIRVDVPQDLDPTTLVTDPDPTPLIGPMIVTDQLPVVTQQATVTITARGVRQSSYPVLVNGDRTNNVSIDAGTGLGSVNVTLAPGLDRVCVAVSSSVVSKDQTSDPEATNCVILAYIPSS